MYAAGLTMKIDKVEAFKEKFEQIDDVHDSAGRFVGGG